MDGSNTAPEVGPGAATALVHAANSEASVGDHLRELGLLRETADAFDEVLVRVAVAGEDRAEDGDYLEGVLVVYSGRRGEELAPRAHKRTAEAGLVRRDEANGITHTCGRGGS